MVHLTSTAFLNFSVTMTLVVLLVFWVVSNQFKKAEAMKQFYGFFSWMGIIWGDW